MSIRVLVISFLIGLVSGTAFGAEQDIAVAVRVSGDTVPAGHEAGDVFVVKATIKAPVTLQTAWEVLVDYDHMTTILSNLSASKVASRNGNVLIVNQEGVARFGLFSYPFQVEREIRLEPMKRILSRNLTGSLKRMESDVRLNPSNQGSSVQIEYRAEFVFDSILAGLFAVSFLHHEVEEQFQFMVAEMKRREAQLSSGAPLQTQ